MGAVVLCHAKTAKRPWYFQEVRREVYTIEELAYYLYENLCLVDRDTIGEELLHWLSGELHMDGLVQILRSEKKDGFSSIHRLLLPILAASGLYTQEELKDAKEQLLRLKGLTEAERRKYRADVFLKNERYEAAVREYGLLLDDIYGREPSPEFTATLWHNLGCAYAGQFYFDLAAEAFKRAAALSRNEAHVQAYQAAESAEFMTK